MPAVFINYRTGDGEHVATILHQALTGRFGEGTSFRASESIRASQSYAEELIRGVRRAEALVVVVGPNWSSSPLLHDEADWVRKEILEAFANQIPVVPVLAGREVTRLRQHELPAPLKPLAGLQYIRYDNQNAARDLAHLMDELLYVVPELAKKEKSEPTDGAARRTSTQNTVSGGTQGVVLQGSGEFSGDVFHSSIGNAHGPVHTGKGNQTINNSHAGSQVSHGDGATFVQGGNHGGIQHHHRHEQLGEGHEQ